MTKHVAPTQAPPQGITSLSVLLARVLWTLALPAMTVLCTYRITTAGHGWFAGWDCVFWILVALMAGCRWHEQRSGQATTITGEPSTPRHLHRYVFVLMLVAGSAWAIAKALGMYVWASGG